MPGATKCPSTGSRASGMSTGGAHGADSLPPSVTCPQSIGQPLLVIAGPPLAAPLWQQHLDLLRQQAAVLVAPAASGVRDARQKSSARPMAAKPRTCRNEKPLCIP